MSTTIDGITYDDGHFYFWLGKNALSYWPAHTGAMPVYYVRRPMMHNQANFPQNPETSQEPWGDAHELALPEQFQMAIMDWALWHAMERLGLDVQAKNHRLQYAFARREAQESAAGVDIFKSAARSRTPLTFGTKGV